MSRNVVMKVSLFKYILNSAIKRLIASKIKVFVFIIYVCVLCMFYYVYINTHTYSIYFENICMYIFIEIISYHM